MSVKAFFSILVVVVFIWPGCIGASDPHLLSPVAHLTEKIPPQEDAGTTGSEFTRRISGMTPGEREAAALDEFTDGNIPLFLRHLKPVELSYRPIRAKKVTAVIWVMPDYLSIGTDEDFVRIPMTLPTAVAVARQYGFTLPTRKMVDAIYRQSDFHLGPQPMMPGPRMSSSEYYWEHNKKIEKQRNGRPLGELISGHKKDLVLTNRLAKKARRVAIYGWHKLSGLPIQPLSTVHGARYVDYSHGVRLVSTTVLVDGVPRSIFEILRDPELARLLSYEGTIPDAEQLMSAEHKTDMERRGRAQVLSRTRLE